MNHGQTSAQTDQSPRAAAERARILAAFRAVFTSSDGKLVLAVLQHSAGCAPGQRRPSFVFPPGRGAPACPYLAAYNDGRKSILDEIDSHLATPEDQPAEEPKAVGK